MRACGIRILTGFVLLAQAGCVPIPVSKVPERVFERDIGEQTMQPFVAGKTTRREIVLRLGQPDGVMDDERTLLYVADAAEGGHTWRYLFALPAGPAMGVVGMSGESAPPKTRELYRLTIWFDDRGLMKDYKFERAASP